MPLTHQDTSPHFPNLVAHPVGKRGLIGYAPSAPWIPSEGQFADLLVYVFARMSLRNQALILVLYDGALRREEVTFLEM